ncbi:MAG: hypothetical protein GX750_04265 [Clostridia bacterium]|nr:hypothetical protein [Clostridia bacterium]
MLFWIIGLLSVILGFCVAIHMVFQRLDSRVTWVSILITLILGIVFSAITEVVMVAVIWPPVTLLSWVIFAVFAGLVLLLLLTDSKRTEESW